MLKIETASTQADSPSIPTKNTLDASRQVFEVVKMILELQARRERRDDYDAVAPNPDSIGHALRWIRDMHDDALKTGEEWLRPHVSTDEDGDVAFEWWRADKKLTIYIGPETAEYIKVERPVTTSDLIDGRAETPEDRRTLWRWLTS